MNGTLIIDIPSLVQFKLYDFGFKMQELSDFEIPDFLIPDSKFPISPGVDVGPTRLAWSNLKFMISALRCRNRPISRSQIS